MRKSKKSREPRDRLSELPDSLIFDIFWFLPMTDVVRTTVLSSRWKDLWTTAPYLNFEDRRMDIATRRVRNFLNRKDRRMDIATRRVRNFLNRVLIFWKGIKILKFKIEVASDVAESFYRDVDLWVRFAKRHGVEELYVDFRCLDGKVGIDAIDSDYDSSSDTSVKGVEVTHLPQHLYSSCPSLRVLRLKGCQLQTYGNVFCNQLKSLTIDGFYFNERTIARVLSSSPQLEVFILTLVESRGDLNIQSSSLKRLSIERHLEFNENRPSSMEKLKIWTPNLETLEIHGVPDGVYSLMNVSCLTDATLGFYGPEHYYDRCFFEDHLLEHRLTEILPTIQHVERVTLSNWCIQELLAMIQKCLLSPLSNVQFLKLMINDSFDEHQQMVGLLEIFPKLKTLVVQHENVVINRRYADIRVRKSLEPDAKFETNLSNPFLLQLRTVEISWTESENIFPFIEIVLKYASKLEKMVFRVKGSMPLASQKLLRMERSSPNAELICCEY